VLLLFVTPASSFPRGFSYPGHNMVVAVVEESVGWVKRQGEDENKPRRPSWFVFGTH
jgi:hypothetical protein